MRHSGSVYDPQPRSGCPEIAAPAAAGASKDWMAGIHGRGTGFAGADGALAAGAGALVAVRLRETGAGAPMAGGQGSPGSPSRRNGPLRGS
jgi:hypothetical protein